MRYENRVYCTRRAIVATSEHVTEASGEGWELVAVVIDGDTIFHYWRVPIYDDDEIEPEELER